MIFLSTLCNSPTSANPHPTPATTTPGRSCRIGCDAFWRPQRELEWRSSTTLARRMTSIPKTNMTSADDSRCGRLRKTTIKKGSTRGPYSERQKLKTVLLKSVSTTRAKALRPEIINLCDDLKLPVRMEFGSGQKRKSPPQIRSRSHRMKSTDLSPSVTLGPRIPRAQIS